MGNGQWALGWQFMQMFGHMQCVAADFRPCVTVASGQSVDGASLGGNKSSRRRRKQKTGKKSSGHQGSEAWERDTNGGIPW